MLVLSRKINETILIGEDIRVTLLGIDGDKIKIGIDAPKTTRIFREELIQATIATNRQAASAPLVTFDLSRLGNSGNSADEPADKNDNSTEM